MRLHNLSFVCVITATVLSAPSLLAAEQTEIPAYQYGSQLDIASVIRIEEPAPPTCEVVRAKMTFVSKQGVTEQVSFLKQAQACVHQ